ncbi:VOC family protein [Echinicola strongylocentroti]|uniref:VOC family protein n=1 Tax=Echinicola strongylocentroti TaxID=1795355 RepID=A0A2Z4IIR6_9BACT|nr:VOC family protein [Echinicola strongylocentroti]AWW31021.1 VOC family protein [Echinicola strongylocentroti]
MIKINPYISFDGNCQEAMTFYQQCLGGDLQLMTMADGPMSEQTPKDQLSQIMHAELRNGDLVLMATDMQGPDGHQPGNDMGIQLTFDDEAEIHRCFDQLAEGGKVYEPVRKQFWGDTFGVLRDKFGKKWQVLLPDLSN